MDKTGSHGKTPNADRIEALKNLPSEVMKKLTKEEINAFLLDDVWPDSMREKLKDYLFAAD